MLCADRDTDIFIITALNKHTTHEITLNVQIFFFKNVLLDDMEDTKSVENFVWTF